MEIIAREKIKMTTYYFGVMEFGEFNLFDEEDRFPLAIIRRLDHVQEFATEEEAECYFMDSGFDSFIASNAMNQWHQPYEIVFKRGSV